MPNRATGAIKQPQISMAVTTPGNSDKAPADSPEAAGTIWLVMVYMFIARPRTAGVASACNPATTRLTTMPPTPTDGRSVTARRFPHQPPNSRAG